MPLWIRWNSHKHSADARQPGCDFAFPDTNFVKALLAMLSALRLVAGSKHAPRAFDSATYWPNHENDHHQPPNFSSPILHTYEYTIVYYSMLWRATTNCAVNKVNKYSRAQTCRLTAFCVKLIYITFLRYRGAADEVAVKICVFVLRIFLVEKCKWFYFIRIVFYIYFKILPVGSILHIAYTLITVCCKAPQTIMELAV